MSQSPPSQVSAALGGPEDNAPFNPPELTSTTRRPRTFWQKAAIVPRQIWRTVTTNRKVALGSGIITFFVLVALFGPLFIKGDPNTFTRDLLAPPSAEHWLGTNQGGQDIFGQLIIGTRSSVFWSFVTGLLVMVIAVTIGLVGGYFGGVVDDILSLITNVFLVIPAFPLAIVAVEFFSRSTLTIVLIVAFTNWPWGARVIRAQTLSMRSREFVTAARSSGESTGRLIFFDILPNEISIVAASFITTTIQVLLAVAGLEFLGFGDNTAVSWGIMLNASYNASALFQGTWWWFAPPGLCIAILGSGLALLNFGIDEIADPRLRQVRRKILKVSRSAALAQVVDTVLPGGRRAAREKASEA